MLLTEDLRALCEKKKKRKSWHTFDPKYDFEQQTDTERLIKKKKKDSLLNKDPDAVHDPFENPIGLTQFGISKVSGQRPFVKTWRGKMFVLLYTLTALDKFAEWTIDYGAVKPYTNFRRELIQGATKGIYKKAQSILKKLEDGKEVNFGQFSIRLTNTQIDEAAIVPIVARAVAGMVAKRIAKWLYNNFEGEIRIGNYIVSKKKLKDRAE